MRSRLQRPRRKPDHLRVGATESRSQRFLPRDGSDGSINENSETNNSAQRAGEQQPERTRGSPNWGLGPIYKALTKIYKTLGIRPCLTNCGKTRTLNPELIKINVAGSGVVLGRPFYCCCSRNLRRSKANDATSPLPSNTMLDGSGTVDGGGPPIEQPAPHDSRSTDSNWETNSVPLLVSGETQSPRVPAFAIMM